MHGGVELDVAGGRAQEGIGSNRRPGPLVIIIFDVVPIADHQRGDDEDGDEAEPGEDYLHNCECIACEFAHVSEPPNAWWLVELRERRAFRYRHRRALPIRPGAFRAPCGPR